MKLWKISQDRNLTYDTYECAIVAAGSEDVAKRMHPEDGHDITKDARSWDWVTDPDSVECEYLGEAKPGTEQGVLCASFIAG